MMMTGEFSLLLPFLLLFLPLGLALVGLLLPLPPTWSMRFCTGGTVLVSLVALVAASMVFVSGQPMGATGGWLMLDALSAWHLVVMALVFSFCSMYAVSYFKEDIEEGSFTPRKVRRFNGLWFGAMMAMMLVMLSNNLGLMWVGIEATTLLTAFLICIHATPAALEAMWKYLLMCSVGVAVAFTGILMVAASAGSVPGLHSTHALLWTELIKAAPALSPMLVKAGFIFMVIGYGTKAGLAPMHNWLPDAHSQAPAPVSAVFSGFMLSAALYCILRVLPIVESATGNEGWGREILVVFGLVSILLAAVFIVAQHDVKRLLAYSSVEHMGIVALGAGMGGAGVAASLFHILNHSLCKSLAFYSAGKVGRLYGTQDMRALVHVTSSAGVWGVGLVVGMLALIGAAPFALFLSEFLILKAAINGGQYGVAAMYLFGLVIVFVGVLRFVIHMAWGERDEGLTVGQAVGMTEQATGKRVSRGVAWAAAGGGGATACSGYSGEVAGASGDVASSVSYVVTDANFNGVATGDGRGTAAVPIALRVSPVPTVNLDPVKVAGCGKSVLGKVVVFTILGALLLLGIYVPGFLQSAIGQAAALLGGSW